MSRSAGRYSGVGTQARNCSTMRSATKVSTCTEGGGSTCTRLSPVAILSIALRACATLMESGTVMLTSMRRRGSRLWLVIAELHSFWLGVKM